MLEALNHGELDFATTGEAPPIFAQAAGAPLLYVGVEPAAPLGEAIVVPQAPPVRAVAELRGKRVALRRRADAALVEARVLDGFRFVCAAAASPQTVI